MTKWGKNAVEKAILAACSSVYNAGCVYPDCRGCDTSGVARAAIAAFLDALQKPSEEMVAAAYLTFENQFVSNTAIKLMTRAMLSQAAREIEE